VKAKATAKATAHVVKVGGKKVIINTVETTSNFLLKNVLCNPKKKSCRRDIQTVPMQHNFLLPIVIDGKQITLLVKATQKIQSDIVVKKQTNQLCTLSGVVSSKFTTVSAEIAKKNEVGTPTTSITRPLMFGCIKQGAVAVLGVAAVTPINQNGIAVDVESPIIASQVLIKCPKKIK
jgi:hypothetical protein